MKCPKCGTDNPQDSRYCRGCAARLQTEAGDSPHAPRSEEFPQATETVQTAVKELATGSTFAGRYQVIEELGRGGMGRVYKVFDAEIHEKIALKLLKPEVAEDRETIDRFRNELKTARRIGHRNVCRMFDLNRAEGSYYITMEFVAGEDLKKLVRKIGQMPVGKAVSIARQVSEGLVEAHALGIIHRDLKPQNIMVDEGGNAHIMDFGIARSMKTTGITGAGVIIGTPEYMSPEQVEAKEVDQLSDIYSLGVILYEMATGRVPFAADTPFAVGVKHKSEIPRNPRELNANIPEDLSRLILTCLEKDKAARYQSAEALRADLARIEDGLPTTEKIIPKRKGVTTRDITVTFNIRKLVVPALGVAALIAAGVLLWKVFGVKKPATVAASGKPSIAVMYFDNQTDMQGLDKMLVTLLTTNLNNRYKNIEVTSTQRLFDILKLLGKQDAQTIDRSLATDVATRAGVKTMLLGSVIKIGQRLRLTSELIDVQSGSIVGTQAEDGTQYDDIFGMVDKITDQVGEQIGGAKGENSLNVADVTTSSLQALDYYQKGCDKFFRWDYEEAEKLYRQAVEVDPTFAIAYAYLAMAELGGPAAFTLYTDFTEAKKTLESAKEYSFKATDNERLLIQMIDAGLNRDWSTAAGFARELISRDVPDRWAYTTIMADQLANRDFQAAIRTMEKALENDPTDGNSYNMLGYTYAWLNDYPAALSAMKKYIKVQPDVFNSYDSAWEISMCAGQFEEAVKYADEAMSTHPAWTWFDSLAGLALIHEGKGDAARGRFRRLAQIVPGWGPAAARYEAYSYLREGRYREAGERLIQSLAMSQKSGDALNEVFMQLRVGEALLIQGRLTEAIAHFREAEQISGKYYKHDFNPIPLASRLYIGRALAKQRQFDRAEAVAQEIRTIIQNENMAPDYLDFYHILEAEMALAQGQPEDALKSLGRASFHAWWTSPIYYQIKASAEESVGRFEAAIESLKKFLGYVSMVRSDLRDPVRYFYELSMVDYDLGRVSEKMKNPAAAKEHYQKFLEGMKNADPGIPEIADAKKRLAALG